ncbi:HAD-IIIA family hydrolase [Candidatus Pelagibacter sp.]|nr:HAD-IIIA family hydrolase [Candidatus Pelagibacter sp.]
MIMQDLVILCGGRGTRLGNLTRKTPKPLIKFNKEPFIEKILKFYQRYQFSNIYLLAGYKGEMFFERYNNKFINFTKIKVILEKTPMGTAGALHNIKKIIKNNFLLINADSYIDYDFLKFQKIKFKLAKMLIVKNDNYKENKKLACLDIKKNKVIFKNNKGHNYMNAGVYFLNKKIINYIPNKFCSLEEDVLPNLIKKGKINGQKVDNPFIDMGTKKNLVRVNKFFKKLTYKPAIFLDRDGVINKDFGYVYKFNQIKWINKTISILKNIKNLNIYIFVVTNQSGIGRKYYTINHFNILHKKIKKFLSKKNIFFDEVFFCPHHPTEGKGIYKKKCNCRKPNNKMIMDAKKKWNVDLNNSLMIGDKLSDELCAKKSKMSFLYINKISKINLKSFFKF